MQALLQETMRLREENDVLRIQVSSSGPPHGQRSRGQGANSRHNQGVAYPGTIGVAPDILNERPSERPLPTYHTPQDESSDSTSVSSKRQCDKRPQLSDAMRARLGLEAPGKDRPPTAATWETYPNPPVAPITRGNPPQQTIRQTGGNSSNESPYAPSVGDWTTCSPRLLARLLLTTIPQEGFSCRNFLRTTGLAICLIISCTTGNS